ncbi:LacI family DNA-binding transcriptional regulator [Amycolatopsis thermophila]|uniref:LacI family transcriptional regulator n=1 Tax=Amycolatopsis thermophila TaxID=206084 RepID=A0ABU0EWJ2_9PSEU|nr:LacI family DNA-binding transcriptional regulator [Amycolatopsis thermophila]MDQ0379685.1 LacI family transcriptional regulator [Amycolatopsis thermophila]
MSDRPHVTLEDVARTAEVSLATASRALNGTTRVRDDLRDRVLAAAAELAYTPNAHAQALAGASRRTVGVICHDISDPYFAAVTRGVMRVADRNGLLVMLAGTFADPDRELAYVSTLRAQRASAIVLTGSAFEDRAWERAMAAELDPYRRGGGRVAVVTRHRSLKADTVAPENRAGARAMAEAMHRLGHRRFAVVAGPARLTTVADRVAGFRDGLAGLGVELSERDVFEGSFDRDGGFRAAEELLDAGHKATCVLTASDVMAVGVVAALRTAGVSVPDDVSVTGFDDVPLVRDLTPPLTTVALPLERLGEEAMELALDTSAGGGGARGRVRRLAGEVLLRESTAKPRRRRRR